MFLPCNKEVFARRPSCQLLENILLGSLNNVVWAPDAVVTLPSFSPRCIDVRDEEHGVRERNDVHTADFHGLAQTKDETPEDRVSS